MMQTRAERFFFFLFWKMFFCVVSDGKRKKEKHASSIGSSTGGPFFSFFFLFCCFFAEIADGVTRAACDEIPTWKARAGLLRWLLQHTVQRVCVCVKQPADETSVWKHRCRAKVNEPRHPLSTSAASSSRRRRRLLACCAINKSAAALCVRRRRNYCKQTRRAFKMTDRPSVCVRCGQILLYGTYSRKREREWKLWERGADNNKVCYLKKKCIFNVKKSTSGVFLSEETVIDVKNTTLKSKYRRKNHL